MTSPVSGALHATQVAAGEFGSRAEKVRERDDSSSKRTDGPVDRPEARQEPSAVEAAASTLRDGPETVLSHGRSIEFSFDDHSNRVVVKVVSEDDGEIIRQIPPEQYLKFRERLRDMVGVLFDEKG